MRKENLETQFNQMAGGAEGPDAARSRRSRNAGLAVIEYANIEKEFADIPEEGQKLKAKMQDYMDAIDRDPTSFEAIIAYGTAPIIELGKVGDSILKIQSKFDEQVRVLTVAQDNMDKGLAQMGIEKLVSGVKKLANGAVDVGSSAASGLFKATKSAWEKLSGAAKKRTEEEQQVHDMIENLPKMYFEMQALALGMKNAEGGIKAVMTEAAKLGVARVETARELNIYLGAAPEVLRRYSEIYIKQAQEEYDATLDPEDQFYLENLLRARDNFQDQYNVLEGSRAQSHVAVQQLKMLMEQMEKQRKIIQQSSTVRENEWKALLSGAGFAASSLKVAAMIKKNDEAGDRIHTLTTDMMMKAHEMTLNSQGRGTIDPKKLVESLTSMQKMIEREAEVREQRQRELEASRQMIRASTEKLLESVEAAKQGRMLEASKDAVKGATPAAPSSSNDNASAEDAPSAKKTGTDHTGPR